MLTPQIKSLIKKYTLDEKPNEICGLILKFPNSYELFSCENISYHKTEHCILNPLDYVHADKIGNIVAHYHSQEHDNPSILDNITAFNQNLYSIVYCWKNDKFYIIEPKLEDYLNIDFQIGINDCFSLVQRYYKREKNIIINNYNRKDNWHLIEPQIIYNNIINEGFKEIKIDEIQKSDLLFFGKSKNELYHIGIYLNNNLMLHHPRDNVSVIEYLNSLWKNKIKMAVRYYGK